MAKKLAVVAIDFGTTCTGYAYYLKTAVQNPSNLINSINIQQTWEGVGSEVNLQAPTTVLMQPDKTFHSFGFEAERKYKRLTLTKDHNGWYYFRHFKMILHHEKELTRDTLLEDSEGKPMKAITVFTCAIESVRDHLLEKLKDVVVDKIQPDQISWVMTVPAIWRDSAKQFMREASVQAGIPSDDLVLALEPESAAIFCKELALKQQGGTGGVSLSVFNPKEKYLVCDLGGGTVDTTVHEVKSNGMLEELHSATGGDWGGQQVNKAFEQLLSDTMGTSTFSTFRTKHTHAWVILQKNFEECKRSFSSNPEERDIELPGDFVSIYTENETSIRLPKGVQIINQTLRLSVDALSALFDVVTAKITTHIEGLLKQLGLEGVFILLVGGFSESPIVKNTIKMHFHTNRVITPESAASAIIKGAVMFGLDMQRIAARLSPYTYGVHTRRRFNKKKHSQNRRKLFKGMEVVENAFSRHIVKGKLMYVGVEPNGSTFKISNINCRKVHWNVYKSTEETPEFCDEESCTKVGQLMVDIPSSIEAQQISMRVTMTCRGTELEAKAFLVDYPQIEALAKLEFLEQEYASASDFIEDEQ